MSVAYKLHIYIYFKKRHKIALSFVQRSELICKKIRKDQTHLTRLQGVVEHLLPYVSKVLGS